MQEIRVGMDDENLMNCLSMFRSCDQHPRTLDKLADYSAIEQDETYMIALQENTSLARKT